MTNGVRNGVCNGVTNGRTNDVCTTVQNQNQNQTVVKAFGWLSIQSKSKIVKALTREAGNDWSWVR